MFVQILLSKEYTEPERRWEDFYHFAKINKLSLCLLDNNQQRAWAGQPPARGRGYLGAHEAVA